MPPFYRGTGGKLRMLAEAREHQVDGIIVSVDDAKVAKALVHTGLPAIVSPVKGPVPGFPCIFDDGDTPGKMAASYLLSLGLRNFAFCGFEDLSWSQSRGEDFDRTIADGGFQTHRYKVPRSKVQRLWENEQTVLADWLKSLPKPLGLMTCNDDRGHYVIEACQIAELRVPDDVAVIGVDNDELICDLTAPPLSSIALSHETAGYRAAQLLDSMMAGRKVDRRTTVPLEALRVVVRQSTDVLAIEDPELASAVRFIRLHSNEAIQVSDVVDSVAVSRRVLERRFRRVFKGSVYDEIRRVRVERVARMLLETDLSVSQIALDLAYPSDKHVARCFRKEKGVTPQQYRRKFGPGPSNRVSLKIPRETTIP